MPEAERIHRLAFGTHKGLANPMDHGGDTNVVLCRYRISPEDTFGAWQDGKLAGSNYLTLWGSVAFFGPVSVAPHLWNRSIAKLLVTAVLERAREKGATFIGLFTFGESVKHLTTYQNFGFMPRHLTVMMAREAKPSPGIPPLLYSTLGPQAREDFLAAARVLTDRLYPGLDLTNEIAATTRLGLGDTIIVEEGGELAGFAVCQSGGGTEGGAGALYVKFGAADSAPRFAGLLDACDRFAVELGVPKVATGINTSRTGAYRILLDRGFKLLRTGVAMHLPDIDAYSHPGAFVLDDWR